MADSRNKSLPTMELRVPLPGLLKRLVVAMLGALLLLSTPTALGKPKKDLHGYGSGLLVVSLTAVFADDLYGILFPTCEIVTIWSQRGDLLSCSGWSKAAY